MTPPACAAAFLHQPEMVFWVREREGGGGMRRRRRRRVEGGGCGGGGWRVERGG